jgi:hypothetical protein
MYGGLIFTTVIIIGLAKRYQVMGEIRDFIKNNDY